MSASTVVRTATWACCAFGTALALAGLIGGVAGSVVVPFGPNWGLHFALDAVAALFLLIVCLSGAVAAPESEAPLLLVAVGALALTLLAADGVTLVLGFGIASAAAWALDGRTQPTLVQAACGALFLAAALLLSAPPGAGLDLRFAAIRAAPPEGLRAFAVLLLTLLGVGSCVAWPSRSGPVGALLSGSMAAVAAYMLLRVLLDLCGPSVPGWWGLPLLVVGAGAAIIGGLRANAADNLLAILAAGRLGAAGLISVGLGVALAARGSDLTSLAALALAGSLLHAIGYAVLDTLLVLCAAAVSHGAGTQVLSQLGALLRTMPGVGLGALAGAAGLAGLPLSPGFAGRWLIVQSLIADQRLGGIWLQLGFALVLAAVALGVALAAAAAVRLIGIGFLGQPRMPQAAAATDAPRRIRLVIAGLAASCLLIGVWPSAALALVQPALRRLLGAGMEGGHLFVLLPQLGSPGYAAPGIVAVLALSGLAVAWAMSRAPIPKLRPVPAWNGGLEGAPPSQPSGDPAPQYSATSAAQSLLQSLGYPINWPGLKRVASIGRIRRPKPARSAAALLLVLAGLLLWAVA